MIEQIRKILISGKLSGFRGNPEGTNGGYWVQKLEESFREYFNVKHAISMNSATACLHSALIACNVERNDEVLVTPYSFSSSASCVLMAGGKPQFGDIDEDTFNLSPQALESFWGRVVIPVHLMGHPADLDAFKRHKVKDACYDYTIIEDCAQAIGARYKDKLVGTIGACGIFSFNQSKHINTGEGGMLITNDDYIARICKAVRNHGEVSDPELKIVGYNYRMCEIEAYLAWQQFNTIDENLDYRNELTSYMSELLSQVEGLVPPVIKDYCTRHSFYTYGVKVTNGRRDEIQQKLKEKGIYFGHGGYVKPLYHLPIYNTDMRLPVCEKMYETIMVTDIFKKGMTKKDCLNIYEEIQKIMSS